MNKMRGEKKSKVSKVPHMSKRKKKKKKKKEEENKKKKKIE
jgi:hypothetical protein